MNPDLTWERKGAQVASELVPARDIAGDDEEDTALLRKMLEWARRYVSSFSWCEAVLDSFFGGGVGGVFAVFFFHIRPARASVDPWLWVMVGDIPSAYLGIRDCGSAAEAFREYIRGMKKWVELARKGQTGTAEEGVPPVNVPATPEEAEILDQRLNTLKLVIKPFFEDEENERVN
ncbi:MAG: hypothetical protein ACLP3K_11720 [Candidatus Acidiferrales bacterium]